MTTPPALSPLDMALNLVAAVQRAAEHIEADELDAYLNQTGNRAYAGAQMAAYLAVVSIAEDVHAVRAVLTRADDALAFMERQEKRDAQPPEDPLPF